MPQTLLAMCAMMAAVLFSLNLQRSTLDSRVRMLQMEAATQAAEVGSQVLEYIGSQPFDRALESTSQLLPVTDLTPTADFGEGLEFEACEVIEDFHNMQPYEIEVDYHKFVVEAEVRYVDYIDSATVPSLLQTYDKEVVLTITGKHVPSPIRLSRVFTY